MYCIIYVLYNEIYVYNVYLHIIPQKWIKVDLVLSHFLAWMAKRVYIKINRYIFLKNFITMLNFIISKMLEKKWRLACSSFISIYL